MEKKEIIICPCGNSFQSYISHKRKYCSRICLHNYRPKNWGTKLIDLVCIICKETFKGYISHNRKCCSRKCVHKYLTLNFSGINGSRWVENKKVNPFKGTSKWRIWRQAVFARDNYTCQNCNKRGGYLEPHHIKSKQCFPELVFEVSNGITLCGDCHNQLHWLVPSNGSVKIKEYPISILKNKIEVN